jgi:muramoyltetrapeptide carboxypeptidase LdcA involved in peptidoglycan recycling
LKKRLSIPIDCISGNKDFSWKIFGGHLLIFSQIYEYFQFNIHNTLLYLEFHWMEEYMIEYIINILALKNIFSQITWIIFEENIDINIIHKFQKIWIKNVYKLKWFSYLPLFQEVIIEWNSLIYEKRYN